MYKTVQQSTLCSRRGTRRSVLLLELRRGRAEAPVPQAPCWAMVREGSVCPSLLSPCLLSEVGNQTPGIALHWRAHTGRQHTFTPWALPWLESKFLCSLMCVCRGSFHRVETLECDNTLERETNLSQDFCGLRQSNMCGWMWLPSGKYFGSFVPF